MNEDKTNINSQSYHKTHQSGFIKSTLIIVGALVILKYAYNIDVVGFLTTGKFKGWLDELYKFGNKSWGEYRDIITNIWDIIKNIFSKINK